MATQFDIEVAIATMDELTTRLRANIRSGGFDNNSVMWLIKAWAKVGIRLRGASFHKQVAAYYIMKRDPSPSTGKRSQTLLTAMDAFETILTKNGTTGGDYFQRADKAMLDFVWEYRKHLSPTGPPAKSEQDFVAQLTRWSSAGPDQAQKAIITNVERHI